MYRAILVLRCLRLIRYIVAAQQYWIWCQIRVLYWLLGICGVLAFHDLGKVRKLDLYQKVSDSHQIESRFVKTRLVKTRTVIL
jgi:hypothetical protein